MLFVRVNIEYNPDSISLEEYNNVPENICKHSNLVSHTGLNVDNISSKKAPLDCHGRQGDTYLGGTYNDVRRTAMYNNNNDVQ